MMKRNKELKTNEEIAKFMEGFYTMPNHIMQRYFEECAANVEEVFPIIKDDFVYYNNKEYQVTNVDYVKNEEGIDLLKTKVTIKSDVPGEEITVCYSELEIRGEAFAPMYKVLWSFKDFADESWAILNQEKLAQCGFRIFIDNSYDDIYIGLYENEEDDFVIEKHFIPLYEAMNSDK